MRLEFSAKTKALAFRRAGGFCEGCGTKLHVGRFEFDHIHCAAEEGANYLDNCSVLCSGPGSCHAAKTRTDKGRMAKTERQFRRNIGIKRAKGRPMPGSKASGLRKRFDGTVERRT